MMIRSKIVTNAVAGYGSYVLKFIKVYTVMVLSYKSKLRSLPLWRSRTLSETFIRGSRGTEKSLMECKVIMSLPYIVKYALLRIDVTYLWIRTWLLRYWLWWWIQIYSKIIFMIEQFQIKINENCSCVDGGHDN